MELWGWLRVPKKGYEGTRHRRGSYHTRGRHPLQLTEARDEAPVQDHVRAGMQAQQPPAQHCHLRFDATELFATSILCLQDLIEDIRSELSGDFRESVMACFVTPARYDAWSVKESIYVSDTDSDWMLPIQSPGLNSSTTLDWWNGEINRENRI